MSTLDTLPPIDHALVSRHLQRLRAMPDVRGRRSYLSTLARIDGPDMRTLVERCFAEEWAERKRVEARMAEGAWQEQGTC